MGICGTHKANGPSVITGVLFISTIIYNVLMNRYVTPLEERLPEGLTSPEARDEELMPLLSDIEEGQGTFISSTANNGTRTRAFQSSALASYGPMKFWSREGSAVDTADIEIPDYTEEELTRAYLHPALTSETPVIWMPRDPVGASKAEVRETEEGGLSASDEGAWLDESRIVHWDVQGCEKLPIWKKAVPY